MGWGVEVSGKSWGFAEYDEFVRVGLGNDVGM